MWIRTGECCRCGECCRSGDPFNGERGAPPIPDACPMHTMVDGIAHCSGYGVDHYYLSGCNVWPSQPSHIVDYPSCTYRFEWRD